MTSACHWGEPCLHSWDWTWGAAPCPAAQCVQGRPIWQGEGVHVPGDIAGLSMVKGHRYRGSSRVQHGEGFLLSVLETETASVLSGQR